MSIPRFKPLDEVDAIARAINPTYKRHPVPGETRQQRAKRHKEMRNHAAYVIRILDAYRIGGYQQELDL